MFRVFVCCILFFLLNGCFPLTSNSLKKIQINNSESDVKKILGKPFSKKAYYNKTFLVYYVHDDFFDIFINTKKFPYFGFFPLLRTGREYWVIIENDKVVAWGLAKNFGNNLPRALSNKGGTLEVMEF